MASNNSHIDKPQRGRPKRAELPDVNMSTGAAQSIYAKRASLNFRRWRPTLVVTGTCILLQSLKVTEN